MDNEGKTVVEINGVKMEVDLRTARVVDTYRVGDTVKLLKKVYSSYDVRPAVIIGFTAFQKLPTIELLSVTRSGEVEFHAINTDTQDMEIAPMNKAEILFDKSDIVASLESNIRVKGEELARAKAKLAAFLSSFGKMSLELEDHTA